MDNFPTLKVIVGIPGSGKTTYCNKYTDVHGGVHISSDSIRRELYGDESIQGDSNYVFHVMQERTLNALSTGKSVLYDATNIKRKDRMTILDKLPSYVTKECEIIWAPIEMCIERDRNRERSVEKEVIDRMLRNFETPYYDEGYNHIYIRTPSNFNFNNYIDEMVEATRIPQDNPHHTLNVYEHCLKCSELVKKYVKEENIIFDQDIIVAAMRHDVGKPYVKSFTNSKGEVTDIAHYYGHQGVGAWMVLGEGRCGVSVSWLVAHHMDPYLNTKYYRSIPEFMKQHIDILHRADVEAH